MIMGDSVHIYIYYSGNPSEAMIAKRRSHACLISYMPPPFIKSGIYGDLIELEESIAEYRESSKTDKGRGETLRRSIVEKAKTMRLPEDIDEIEDELIAMRESLIPRGLHCFGRPYNKEDAECYALNSMRFPHEGIKSLGDILPHLDDADIDRLYGEYNADRKIPAILEGNEDAKTSLEYEYSLMLRSMVTNEFEGLGKALSGRFVDAKPGGDHMKVPEVLPTGHNIVQFNPDRVPTSAAFERGALAAEDMITQYHQRTGEYPHGAALVLWGLETSRTQGMTIGQICGYLGLRLLKTSGNFLNRFEVIPISELGRPRIDVTVSMCGFFRDMFPNLVGGLSDIFSLVASLDEPENMNFCKTNTCRNRRYLEKIGYSGNELDDLSECRLFGPARGEYGTSVTGVVNGASWKEEEELGNIFSDSLRYAYSRNSYGSDVNGLLKINHTDIDIVSQVKDSKDRELIDLDHYYEFLGGLSKAVEIARGRKVSVYVVDGSASKVRVDTVKRSIERGIRTRLLNTKWIDGLLEVKYHGAQQIEDRFENIIGLAATVGEVESGVFSDMFKCYVEDRDVRERVRDNNNWAYISMLNRLFEANSRGYWDATDNELEVLKAVYLESEGIAEAESDKMQL
jgi:cobaltochelatase CobN